MPQKNSERNKEKIEKTTKQGQFCQETRYLSRASLTRVKASFWSSLSTFASGVSARRCCSLAPGCLKYLKNWRAVNLSTRSNNEQMGVGRLVAFEAKVVEGLMFSFGGVSCVDFVCGKRLCERNQHVTPWHPRTSANKTKVFAMALESPSLLHNCCASCARHPWV